MTASAKLNKTATCLRLVGVLLALGACTVFSQTGTDSAGPLDSLSADEIRESTEILRTQGKLGPGARFAIIDLNEPAKDEVLAYSPGAKFRREALSIVYDWKTNTTSEAIVDLNSRKLVSWRKVPGVQPWHLPSDDARAAEILRNDPRWQSALKKRGITDASRVLVLAAPAGPNAPAVTNGSRFCVAVLVARDEANPSDIAVLDWIRALVNLTTGEVLWVKANDVGSSADLKDIFEPKQLPGPRKGAEPLVISQPKGANFEVRGHEVVWQNWHFRFGMRPREGLVLYTVGYEDRGKLRPILYRGAVSEMAVPYGNPEWMMWCPLDGGDVGLGNFGRSSFTPLGDAPANTTYFPATLYNENGEPQEVPRAIALYERDGDTIWRHDDTARRGQQLVLASYAHVGNYDYGFHWVFHQDGTLEAEVLLTGILNVYSVDAKKDSEHSSHRYDHLLAANIAAPHHQHFFNYRLDLDVDGAAGNSVFERNTSGVPEGPENPHHDAIVMRETPLETERQAQRRVNMATSRIWKVFNPSVRNDLGQQSAYLLIPGENSIPYATAKSWIVQHAGFVRAHVWVTPYNRSEMHAAGEYVNTAPPGQGLPKWTLANRSIKNTDVVLWYTMGITHIPRVEEWPVMPIHRAGFKLVPAGFFSTNPALDVPAPQDSAK